MDEILKGLLIGIFISFIICLIYEVNTKTNGDDNMEFEITVKVKTNEHIMSSQLGEFEKELKDRIETALYVELKDDYIKNENVDLEFEVH